MADSNSKATAAVTHFYRLRLMLVGKRSKHSFTFNYTVSITTGLTLATA